MLEKADLVVLFLPKGLNLSQFVNFNNIILERKSQMSTLETSTLISICSRRGKEGKGERAGVRDKTKKIENIEDFRKLSP